MKNICSHSVYVFSSVHVADAASTARQREVWVSNGNESEDACRLACDS